MIELRLPFPPTENHYRGIRVREQVVGLKRKQIPMFYLRQQGKVFRALVQYEARKVMEGREPLVGPVSVSLEVHFPARRGDLQNRIKVLLDALQGEVFKDDVQVHHLEVERRDSKNNGHVLVALRPYMPGIMTLREQADQWKRRAEAAEAKLAEQRPEAA